MLLHRWIMGLAVAAVVALAAVSPALAESLEDGEAESQYLENAWNFVDASMDVSAGIPADARGVLADIREAGVLRVATEPYFPPQEFIDPDLEGQDSYVGADMALARLIASRMGVALQIVPMDFSGPGRADDLFKGLFLRRHPDRQRADDPRRGQRPHHRRRQPGGPKHRGPERFAPGGADV